MKLPRTINAGAEIRRIYGDDALDRLPDDVRALVDAAEWSFEANINAKRVDANGNVPLTITLFPNDAARALERRAAGNP